jgi:amino acid transporter
MKNGVGAAMLLLILTPIVWAAPCALMTAELSSAIPAEGGYYVWVKEALGPGPAFLCGWWSWVYSWLDTALYPSLFFAYLETLWSQLSHGSFADSPWIKWAVGLVLVVVLTYVNIRGAKPTGNLALALGVLLLIPFVLLVAIGLPHAMSHPPSGFGAPGISAQTALGSGLFVAMWNYLGWDSMTTVAEEVERPASTFPKALLIAAPVIVIVYLLPMYVGVANFPDLSKWDEGAWTSVASSIGGPWLAIAMTLAGLMSAAGMFSADLLSASRIPFVLAEDRWLPARLTKQSKRFGTPVAAILVSALFSAIFSYEYFQNLLEVDVVMYSAALTLEFVALVVLRRTQPNLPRPFKIPGGMIGAAVVLVVPTGVLIAGLIHLLGESGRFGAIASLIGIASGLVAYPICKRHSMPMP